MFVDIGIGMVEHIVLYLPIVDIPCQDIDAAAHNSVYPFFGGIGAMVAIVHYVHSHTGHSYTHHYGKQKIGPIGEAKGKYQKIGGKKEGEHYRSLKVKPPVTGLFNIIFFEVIVYALVKGLEKLCWILPRKSDGFFFHKSLIFLQR
jgi:hypothetical protein